MKTLITGATGFVGSAVLRRLLAAGRNVRTLVRPNSDRRNLSGLPVEIVNGDVTDRQSLDRAMEGCSALFHVAADYRLWLPKPDEMYETNVMGTRNVMLAAMDAGIKRVVYTSSVATPRVHAERTPCG
jgi:dihydroflavonol-4-reductase